MLTKERLDEIENCVANDYSSRPPPSLRALFALARRVVAPTDEVVDRLTRFAFAAHAERWGVAGFDDINDARKEEWRGYIRAVLAEIARG